MSERWKECKKCNGLGTVADESRPVELEAKICIRNPKDSDQYIFTKEVKGFHGRECDECLGQGKTGYSEDCPF